MQKPFGASLARKSCPKFGRIDVHRLERDSAALYVETDGVYPGECTLDGCGDRLILVDSAMDGLQLRAGIRENHSGSVGVPRGDANGETGIVEVAHDAATQKSSSAEHRDQLRRHRATLSVALI